MRMCRSSVGFVSLLLLALGCAAPGSDSAGDGYGELESAVTVASYETTTCSTAKVIGLSLQIAAEVNCMMPGQLERFEATENLRFTSAAVLPYLGKEAVAAIKKVSATKSVTLNSAFRTVVQQYLLRQWYERGRCRITAAAQPGRSNHETGRALDIDNYSVLKTSLNSAGWRATVNGDPVHFEFLAAADIRGADVHAFQRLWNRNHPEDQIAEDGDYGAETEKRIAKAPSEGFAKGADCSTAPIKPPDVTDAPDDTSDNEGISEIDGGCNATGVAPSLPGLLLLALALPRRPRRKRA